MSYQAVKIEQKWQKRWQKANPMAQTRPVDSGKKFYCLDMFPYPSGEGLHVGHWRGYVLSDIYARIKWLQGYNVLHPMGWDAFGLPAENDALKKGIHPVQGTAANIARFKEQLIHLAAIYDWSKELNTTDPHYYKWTQWIFLQMYKAGLAYEANMPINWCPSCLTGLANEEVVDEKCERCGTIVEQKKIRQWVLKITAYAEKLLNDLDTLDWPEKVKMMQRNWIGKSEGAYITFKATDLEGHFVDLTVYTTHAETVFGTTFLVIAPEHPLVEKIVSSDMREEVDAYREIIKMMSPAERAEDKEKSGVFSGAYAINPANDQMVPIYIASYVLADYGTGIVLGVPAQDTRDFDFAVTFDLPRLQVVEGPGVIVDEQGNVNKAYVENGPLVNSGPFDGLNAFGEGRHKIIDYLVEKKAARRTVQYRLRDWVFSRQRYWGEPIPLIHCQKCGIVPVPEDQLPVELPDVEQYHPTGTGESPLAAIDWWVNVPCSQCGGKAKRETNTMPQWAGSCWYFLRYPNPHLEDKAFDLKDMNYWLPVDLYVGGIEHAILHLLYARFYVKVLHDLGFLPFAEPFKRLFNQGMILKHSTKTGHVEKMSKSKGNVVNPDDIVSTYGSDVLRMYIIFIGPPELDCVWQDTGLEGVKRFLIKLWNFITTPERITAHEDTEITHRFHQMLKAVQDRIDHFKPNTAISALMEWLNDMQRTEASLTKDSVEKLLVVLSAFAPHIASELLENICQKELYACTWPVYDPSLVLEKEVAIIIQVNGKMRAQVEVKRDREQDEVELLAQALVTKWLAGSSEIKTIYVKNKLINFVTK
ncbi:MAG TPA: leucine--tRNA ligase [Candidatus Bathyarchaeia archaeon]|nr:leucine--tRNA ligase [Candidatus Bathyarchaeia archaeon]